MGIDVGGTFTHAVALDAANYRIVGQVKVSTTHTALNGVAQGIIDSLHRLLEESDIRPEEIALIAHSTTQATNALLEGDVAAVGIVGMGGGVEMTLARRETRVEHLELAPGRFLQTFHDFIDTTNGLAQQQAVACLEKLRGQGAQVFVASEAFGVDNTRNEDLVVETAAKMGLLATNCHEISQLYGLRIRTRTAVINASMLPRMLETANMTEASVRAAGIKAPLMIMRSDGGIMDINEMRRRPILTMLSGPAAGVAAALMYARITDGIFLEVGGTSTDISAIKNGKSLIKSATVGGHRLFLRTLDVRTIGVAGGSIPRAKGKSLHEVGPRSAHIANLGYASFTSLDPQQPVTVELVRPREGDPSDYVKLSQKSAAPFTVTPTCAANLLGLVPPGDCAQGRQDSIRLAFKALAERFGREVEEIARELLTRTLPKIRGVVQGLMQDYKLEENLVTLSGGGGGAASLVPFAAQEMSLPFEIAPNAPVISAIGAALAMVRETVERTVINPSDSDVLNIRREAEEKVVRMGAVPESVEVQVEVDVQKNILRAVAMGSTEFRARELGKSQLDDKTLEAQVRKSLRSEIAQLERVGEVAGVVIFRAETVRRRLGGLFKSRNNQFRVIDREGVIRLQIPEGDCIVEQKRLMGGALHRFFEQHTDYGDAGRAVPDVFVVYRGRILDLSGLTTFEQINSLLGVELARVGEDEPVAALVRKN